MAGTIDRATLDRLIALGRERGELTASEFQAALPTDAMDVEALVLVILELEAAGVSVEPEAWGPRVDVTAAPGIVLSPAAPSPTPPKIPSGTDSQMKADAPMAVLTPPPTAAARAGEDGGVGRVVLLAGLAVLLILGTILVLI
jgi:hypothetical protein